MQISVATYVSDRPIFMQNAQNRSPVPWSSTGEFFRSLIRLARLYDHSKTPLPQLGSLLSAPLGWELLGTTPLKNPTYGDTQV